VGIYAIGCTGDKRAVVLALDGEQVLGFCGENGLYLVDAVGKVTVEDGDNESIAYFQLVEVGKELSARQTSVTRKNTVCALTADGEKYPRYGLRLSAKRLHPCRGR